jgi:DNA-binding LacI/PurR family transcriptional regulator
MPLPTIRDVAREAGVSIATVSGVFNNTRRVGQATRQRVLEVAGRIGYRANVTARNLRASETRLFGFSWRPIPPDSFSPVFDRFLQAIAEAGARHDYRILTYPSASLEDEIAFYEQMMLVGQVDGFILANTSLGDDRIRRLLEANFPFVAFGRSNPEWEFPSVDVDGAAGIELAVQHLIGRGHRRIACLAWPERSLSGAHRLSGYRRAMAEAGLAIEPSWIVRAENSYSEAYASARQMLSDRTDDRPTAIVTMSDLMAIGAINAGWDAGLHVGQDLAVVGFDDAPVARFLRPSLTSLRQPIAEVGERLATMLADLCSGRPLSERQVLLPPELVVRESSG